MRFVVNGDDLGYTKANTLGIIEAYEHGILRSTTALMNAKDIDFAQRAVEGLDGLGIGVHLTLTLGSPLTAGRSITAPSGTFYGRKELYSRVEALDIEDVRREFKAQIESFCDVFGRTPTHIDSHHGVHDMSPAVLEVTRGLAREYGLEMRRYGHFAFVSGFFGPTATAETLISIMQEHLNEDIELMCHPGYCDLDLYRASSYNLDRVRELDALCDPAVIAFAEEHGIDLTHY